MGSSLGIDGLVSGLNTTDLINQLMQVEAAPQTLLKSKQSTAQSVSTALQGINTRLLTLSTSAEKAATASNWKAYSATSSTTSVTASTTSAAHAGSLTFAIDAVAAKQVTLSAAVTSGAGLTASNPPTLTLKKSDGSFVTVTAASNSLDDITKAINDSDMGITATSIKVASGASPTYRLQFTAGKTGTDGAFELYVGDQAAVVGNTATRLDSATATAANNAQITLWKGTAYEQVFTQSSNTFSGLMTGVDVTLGSGATVGSTATVDVAVNSSAVSDLAKNLVGSLGLVLSDIDSRTATTTSTNSDGSTSVKGGVLTGDIGISTARSQLVNAAIYPVNGKSPASVGIVLAKDGTLTFDATKFASALQDDPDGTAAFVQELAGRVQTVADKLSDPYDGSLTARIKGQDSLIKDYSKQIADWDDRLELRRSGLQATYSALEVTLSNMKSQSTWLGSQLSALSSSSG